MNKAFVKEDNDRQPRCPEPDGCGGPGVSVSLTTLGAQVPEADAARLSDEVLYYDDPNCEVAYFDPWGASIPASRVSSPTWPKDPSAPLCPCFGLSREDVIEDAGRRDPLRIRELMKKAEGPDASCQTSTPDGKCCLTLVRRLYFRHLPPDPEANTGGS